MFGRYLRKIIKNSQNSTPEYIYTAIAEGSLTSFAHPVMWQDILLKAVGKEGAAKAGMQFGFVCKPGALCVSVNGKDAGTVKR